jgi:DNA replication and repair protein RecF
MLIEKIQLKSFRNYDNIDINLSDRINIFVGDNAQGKTNLLESIYILGITRSHRTTANNDLIMKNKQSARIRGIVRISDIKRDTFEILLSSEGKKVSINGKIIKKVSDYVSNLNVIIFSPDDLEIIKGAPYLRRRFLNLEIGQVFNKYIVILNDYNNILKNRNKYLKGITIANYDKEYLSILNLQLIEKGLEISEYRRKFINQLQNNVTEISPFFFDEKKIEIKYEPSFPLEGLKERETLKEDLLKRFESNLKREIKMAQTIIGPHRDDFSFYIDYNDMRHYSSQGQHRMAVLCLKLAEINIFNKNKETKPVILLDDVFSELDDSKKNILLELINKDCQVIITTTDITHVISKIANSATVYEVKNATIIKKRGETYEKKSATI